jgi:hypothetical protein
MLLKLLYTHQATKRRLNAVEKLARRERALHIEGPWVYHDIRWMACEQFYALAA